ncbi:MAG TPA: FkbM family methyltransferase [Candidatus Gastranaerophilales bacterium]|nr:FkbM family methyltransferase [Candidatus Gastranaerophilales bacterium]
MKIVKKILFILLVFINRLSGKIIVGNFKLKAPYYHCYHSLFLIYKDYSRNFREIVKKTKKYHPDLKLIDVGANIGDTVAFVKTDVDVPILAIEPNDAYFKYLKQNTQSFNNVKNVKVFLSNKNEKTNQKLICKNGSGFLSENNKNPLNPIELITLDSLLEKEQDFQFSKILKVDTDGYDIKILKGAKDYIKKAQPVIFFEYTATKGQNAEYVFKDDKNQLMFFNDMLNFGYNYAIFYDHLGNFLLSMNLENKSLLEELTNYINIQRHIPYFDICMFHNQDKQIYKDIRNEYI